MHSITWKNFLNQVSQLQKLMSMLRWEHVDYGNRIFHQGFRALKFNVVMETSGQAVPRQIEWGSNSWRKQEKYKTNKKDNAANIPSMNQHSCLHLRTKRSPSLQGMLHFQTNPVNLPLKIII